MHNDFSPILVVPAVPHEEGVRFLLPDDQADIGPSMGKTVWKILEHCNGYNTTEMIAEKTGYELDFVEKLLGELRDLGIVLDSREQYLHFHEIRNYPTNYFYTRTQDEIAKYTASPRARVKTGEVIEYERDMGTFFSGKPAKRRSCRSFADKKLSLWQVGSICHYAYSIKDHAVPSGGGLYPLKIFVIVTEDQSDFPRGYYEYDAEEDHLVLYYTDVDVEQLKYIYNQEEIPFRSQVQIVIAADLGRQTYKYANRGYMLTLIEVGHVAENIALYCAEQELGTCELGGIHDEAMKLELNLDEDVYPILAIPVGYASSETYETTGKTSYVEKNVGKEKLVKNVAARTCHGGDFYSACAVYLDACGNEQYAGAASTAYNDACFKAVIEGYERCLSGNVRIDYHGPARELSDWLNPHDYFPLTPEQAKRCGVKFFTDDLPINWTLGYRYDGKKVYVPTDIVYYGQKSDENRIYYGHSSGIAAYSDKREAEKRALVELIERDAIMRNWYLHESPKRISPEILPMHARKRAKYWEAQGHKLTFLELPSGYGWVYLAVFTSETYPCFVSGAAATIEEEKIPETVIKALQEAECNLQLARESTDRTEINPKDVNTPADHGKLYYFHENAKKLTWLTSGGTVTSYSKIGTSDISELEKKLGVHYVDMSSPQGDLYIVRALSSRLVQINFGYYSAHHNRLNTIVTAESLMMPHYFA